MYFRALFKLLVCLGVSFCVGLLLPGIVVKLVVGISAIDCLERLISEVTFYVSN